MAQASDGDAPTRPGTIAILPLGAHEQHGPHLPFDTDALIAGAMAERIVAALADTVPLKLLPVEPVGYSIEHMTVAGTKTLGYAEAVERWLAIAAGLSRQGIRKLILLNAHGGNAPLMTIVATEARARFAMLAAATSWTRFGVPDGTIGAEAKAIDIHAGMIETSVMLTLHPEKVDMSRARDFPSFQSDMIRNNRHLRAYGPHAFGWLMQDLNPDGAAGNAAAATAEMGEKLIAHAVAGLVELVKDVDAFDVTRFD